MHAIPLTACKSSMVAGVGYDAASKTLAVQFNGGSIYHYAEVPPEVFTDLQRSESVGQFINRQIKGQYAAEKIVVQT